MAEHDLHNIDLPPKLETGHGQKPKNICDLNVLNITNNAIEEVHSAKNKDFESSDITCEQPEVISINDQQTVEPSVNEYKQCNNNNTIEGDKAIDARSINDASKKNNESEVLEDQLPSLIFADPPSGFKDSISNQAVNTETSASPKLQTPSDEEVSLGSESFDQAINNKVIAQGLSTDEASSCNSLPLDLSQIRTAPSSLGGSTEKAIDPDKMPASGPMKFSIAGYTERSNKEAPYIEKLKLGRSDSNVSSYNSSVRYVWNYTGIAILCIIESFKYSKQF